MIIAIDFDGTIVTDRYPNIGEPNQRLIQFLKNLDRSENQIILNTCRVDKYLDEAIAFCKNVGLEFDAVNENLKARIEQYGGDTRKISADIYIDDKAANVETINVLLKAKANKPKDLLGEVKHIYKKELNNEQSNLNEHKT